MWSEHRARAMGTDAQIVVPADQGEILENAILRLADLERRWSRFLPGSEVSQLNSHPGVPVIVSDETFDLIALAMDAWQKTDGRFDPTVHDILVTHGYDRSFEQLPDTTTSPENPSPAPTPASVTLDETLRAVTIPAGVKLDLGGIGKGAAADLIVREAMAAGARGICVNVGGDARVSGDGPVRSAWPIVLQCPGSSETRPMSLSDGAACTSTKLRRQWKTDRGTAHHLIDPTSGLPAETGVASVGVVAARAAQAEVMAKAALLAGPEGAVAFLNRHGLAGVVVTDHGAVMDVVQAPTRSG